jgi:CheY-like chemotaxis protein
MPTKILAIDDSKTMRLAIKITFAAEDADVTSVSKGSEAVARAKQMGADVVLVDATLADGEPSGYEVCKSIKADAATAGIPVLVMVSGQQGQDAAKLQACGADGWIAKPFDTQELIDKVAGALGKPVAKPAAATAAPAARAQPRPAAAPAKPAPAAKPAAPKIPSAPVPREAARAAARPAAAPAARPAAAPIAAKPVPKPAASVAAPAKPAASVAAPAKPAAAAKPAAVAAPTTGADIPIAIPIPFTAADAPTPGILKRLKDASASGSAVAGLDPKVAEALASLSREVVEAVVWEVVPELAEQMIKQQQAHTA